MIKYFIIFAIINYLIGSIEFALIIGKLFFNTDVREHGSGNLGATNTGRVLGKKAALAVGILDALKGILCFLIESKFNYTAALLATVFIAIGHCYPLFAGFKGGKAVATTAGIIFAISLSSFKAFIGIFLIPILIWVFVTKFTAYVSLASLIAVATSFIMSFFIRSNTLVSFVIFVLLMIVVFRHRANIERLIKGEETKKNY